MLLHSGSERTWSFSETCATTFGRFCTSTGGIPIHRLRNVSQRETHAYAKSLAVAGRLFRAGPDGEASRTSSRRKRRSVAKLGPSRGSVLFVDASRRKKSQKSIGGGARRSRMSGPVRAIHTLISHTRTSRPGQQTGGKSRERERRGDGGGDFGSNRPVAAAAT